MQTSTIILMLVGIVAVLTVVVVVQLWLMHRKDEDIKQKNDVIIHEVRRNQTLIDKAVGQGISRAALLTLAALLTCGPAHTQKKQPAGMRVEVCETESDNGVYTIFTYQDKVDDSFGYYLSMGRTNSVLGADEILGMVAKNLHEVSIWLGSDSDEALAKIDDILALFDQDLDSTAEFQGRATTNGFQLGDPLTTTCTVIKRPLGGKRLRFDFKKGKKGKDNHVFLQKSAVKVLQSNFKTDIKLHPKQHRN